jgi:hypothetical protein
MHASDSAPTDDSGSAPPNGAGAPTPPVDRRDRSDRRATEDRRKRAVPVPVERRVGGDRRAQVDRRDPAKRAGNYDLDDETLEFIAAVNRFKTETGRSFPTWSEVLEIVRSLGYVKNS